MGAAFCGGEQVIQAIKTLVTTTAQPALRYCGNGQARLRVHKSRNGAREASPFMEESAVCLTVLPDEVLLRVAASLDSVSSTWVLEHCLNAHHIAALAATCRSFHALVTEPLEALHQMMGSGAIRFGCGSSGNLTLQQCVEIDASYIGPPSRPPRPIQQWPMIVYRALGHALGASQTARRVYLHRHAPAGDCWELPLCDLDLRKAPRFGAPELAFLSALCMRNCASDHPMRERRSLILEDVELSGIAEALAKPLSLTHGHSLATRLIRVWLSNCAICDAGLEHLAHAIGRGSPGLEHLTLCRNCFGSRGLDALAGVVAAGQLRELSECDLGSNAICKIASLAAALATGHAAKLRWLELSNNRLGDDAAYDLAAVLGRGRSVSRLQVLALEGNGISLSALGVLEAALSSAALITEDLRDDLRWAGQLIVGRDLSDVLPYQDS